MQGIGFDYYCNPGIVGPQGGGPQGGGQGGGAQTLYAAMVGGCGHVHTMIGPGGQPTTFLG